MKRIKQGAEEPAMFTPSNVHYCDYYEKGRGALGMAER